MYNAFKVVIYISPDKRFPPKTVNEKKLLSTQSLIFISTKNQLSYSKDHNSFASQPLSTLRFKECRHAIVFSAVLTSLPTKFFKNLF